MAIRKVDLFITFMAPVLLFVLGYAEYLNSDRNTQLLEYLIVPVTLVYVVYYYYKYHAPFLFTSAMPLYYYIGMILSLLMVNNGVLMIEVDQYGSPNGSTLFMLSFFLYSIGVSHLAFNFTMRRGGGNYLPKLSSQVVNKINLGFVLFVILLGFLIFALYLGPVLAGKNRVAFWESMSQTGLAFFPTLMIQSFYFMAYLYLYNKYDKNRQVLPIILLLCYLFLTVMVLGQKFSAFIVYFTVFCSILPGFTDQLQIRKKTLFLLLLSFIAIIIIVVLSYAAQGYDNEFIFTRIALQGQVLWSVINFDFPGLVSENNSCLTNCEGFPSVIDYISYKYLPIATYLHYNSTGTTLSGFSPAAQLLTMGMMPTFILQTIVFLLLGFLQAKAILYNRDRNFVVGFLYFKISFSVFLIWHAVMFTAIKGTLFTFGILLIYILLTKSIKFNKGLNSGA